MKNKSLSEITTYQAGAAQATMHRLLQKYCDEILKPFGITKMQWLIIGNVLDGSKAGVRISDIARNLGTTIPYMTTSINLLESKGFLTRTDNSNDSRSKLITVTPTFAKQCPEIEATLRAGLRKTIYSQVAQDEFAVYMKVLYELTSVTPQTK